MVCHVPLLAIMCLLTGIIMVMALSIVYKGWKRKVIRGGGSGINATTATTVVLLL